MEWRGDEIAAATAKVNKIQGKIRTEYVKNGNSKLVTKLQKDLVLTWEARLLAVHRVMNNKGKNTPGVDKVIWQSKEDVDAAISLLRQETASSHTYKATPVRRVFIPKAGKTELRPLGIPTVYDRGMQALWLQALEPIATSKADPNSYGRLGFGTHHAIEEIRKVLTSKWTPRWILEADIKGFFDNISHEWMLNNIPIDKSILGQWLDAGVLHLGEFQPQESGVPQGGIISPMIANMCLDGLENHILSKTKFQRFTFVIRDVDDFIVTGMSTGQLTFLREVINEFLAIRKLSLHPEKTLITEISQGFDFLGVHIREYPNTAKIYGSRKGILLVKPTEKGIKNIRNKVNALIDNSQNLSTYRFLTKFNQMVGGWAEYYKFYNSSDTFQELGKDFWKSVWKWVSSKYKDTPAKVLVNTQQKSVLQATLQPSKIIKQSSCMTSQKPNP